MHMIVAHRIRWASRIIRVRTTTRPTTRHHAVLLPWGGGGGGSVGQGASRSHYAGPHPLSHRRMPHILLLDICPCDRHPALLARQHARPPPREMPRRKTRTPHAFIWSPPLFCSTAASVPRLCVEGAYAQGLRVSMHRKHGTRANIRASARARASVLKLCV